MTGQIQNWLHFSPVAFNAWGKLILAVLAIASGYANRPNIVFILADDLGYGDVQANNPNSRIPTPSMDRVAAEGMRFTDAHSPSSVCTPTRYGILTGRYCWRTRLKRGVLWGIDGSLIDPRRTTLADVLQEAGYITACVGKWHLGMDFRDADGQLVPNDRTYERVSGIDRVDYSKRVGNSPLSYGFDYSFVITGSLNMFPYAYIECDRFTEAATEFKPRTEHNITIISGGPKAPAFVFDDVVDVFTDKAVTFIRESSRSEQPFFLYFPLTAPHKPVLPSDEFKGTSKLGIYGDFVMQVDDVVGRIDTALLEAGCQENTLYIVTSDNGSFMYRLNEDEPDHTEDFRAVGYHTANHQSNYIWRGTKADIYEAGHRVPMLVRWPETIEPQSTCFQTTTLTDWFATICEILSRPLARGEAEDSFSLLPLLRGSASWNRAPVVHHSSNGMFAIRKGRWKLIAGNGSGGRQGPRGEPFKKPYQLYDLEADPSETRNLILAQPETASQLLSELHTIRSHGRSR